jgi:hypothetical protein
LEVGEPGLSARWIDKSNPGLFKPLSLDGIFHGCKNAAEKRNAVIPKGRDI